MSYYFLSLLVTTGGQATGELGRMEVSTLGSDSKPDARWSWRKILPIGAVTLAVTLGIPGLAQADPDPTPNPDSSAVSVSTVAPDQAISVNQTTSPGNEDDALSALNNIEAESATISEQYAESLQLLDDTKAEKDKLDAQVADQSAKVDGMRTTFAQLVNTNRQTSTLSMTFGFVTSEDTETFLGQLATVASVESIIEGRMSEFSNEMARLESLKEQQAAALQTIEDQVAKQKELLAEQQAREARANALWNDLNDAQRASYGYGSVDTSLADRTGGSSAAQAVVAFAIAQVGKPYVMGGVGPNAYDCSGMTMMAYRQVGVNLPHSATAQVNYGVPVSLNELEPGDLLFYYSPIGHVGIYVGNGMVVDSRNSRVGTVMTSMTVMPITAARRIV